MNPECIFYRKLKHDKIKINWNKRPIEMSLFLSFITVPVERSADHFGVDTGWTQLNNKDLNLVIGGGIIKRVEYLNSLQLGGNLQNNYNNYVNPFYLFDILTDDGKRFFYDYYKDDINEILEAQKNKITSLQKELTQEINTLNDFNVEVENLEKHMVGN